MKPQHATTNMQNNAHLAYYYASTNISKTKQVVMAYDGILKQAAIARQAIEADDPETRFNAIQRACLILLSLQSSLDHNNGGEIAKMLDGFYFSMDVRLMRQNREPNIELLDRVMKEIRLMRDAWADVDAQMTAAGKPDADSTEAAPSIETISSISVSA